MATLHSYPPDYKKKQIIASSYLALAVLIICFLVLLGWAANISFLKHVLPWAIAMNPTTAVCFIFAATALLLNILSYKVKGGKSFAILLSIIITLIGILKITGLFLHIDFNIDSWLFGHKLATNNHSGSPNRMSPSTAVGFIATGSSLLSFIFSIGKNRAPYQYIAVFIWLLGLQSVLGYIYNIKSFYGIGPFLPIAIHTGICFILISMALIFANKNYGFMRHFFYDSSGADTVRKLLAYAVLIPIILGSIRQAADISGIIQSELSVATMILLNILTLLVIIWFTARELNLKDASRRNAENSLRISLKEVSDLKFALDETANVVFFDTNGLITSVNDKYCSISKFASNELIGKNYTLINSDNQQELLIKEIWTTISSGKTWRGEMKNIAKDGACYWVDSTIVPFINEKGKPFKYVAISYDITERKNAEEKVLLLNNELRGRMENSLYTIESVLKKTQKIAHLGIWEYNLKTNQAIWSEEFCKIYGVDPSKNIFSLEEYATLLHPDDRENIFNKIQKSIETKTEISFFNRINRKNDGAERYIYSETLTNYDNHGEPENMFGIAHDVTEIIKAQKELVTTQERYKELLNNMNDGFVVCDKTGKITYANKRFLKIFGIDYIEVENIKWDEHVAPEYKELLRTRHYNRINDGTLDDIFEYKGIRKDGEQVWIEERLKSIQENGNVVGSQSVITDITERKHYEENLQKTTIELTNRVNDLMQFNYIVSHNLRAPIANILGLTSLLVVPDITEIEKQKILNYIRESALKMDDIIRDLNKMLATRSNIISQKQLINIPGLIRNIKETLEKQILETQTIIQLNVSNDCKEIYSVKSYFESIFYNIISNAIKYRCAKRKPIIIINLKKENGSIQITIQDNGIGIDMAKFGNSLFGLYKRFHLDTEGKGLGLFMTRVQVEALRGKIEVNSQLNIGTEFIITIPI